MPDRRDNVGKVKPQDPPLLWASRARGDLARFEDGSALCRAETCGVQINRVEVEG
jgi:hypothetical protein